MKRFLSLVALVAALMLGTGTAAVAHKITVTTPNGTTVLNGKPVARELTPKLFDDEGNYVGRDEGEWSAASQGTNTACEAIPEQSAVTMTGGTCHSTGQ